MSTICVCEDAILVLQAAVTTDRGILDRCERATGQLGTEWPRYTCRKDAIGELGHSVEMRVRLERRRTGGLRRMSEHRRGRWQSVLVRR